MNQSHRFTQLKRLVLHELEDFILLSELLTTSSYSQAQYEQAVLTGSSAHGNGIV